MKENRIPCKVWLWRNAWRLRMCEAVKWCFPCSVNDVIHGLGMGTWLGMYTWIKDEWSKYIVFFPVFCQWRNTWTRDVSSRYMVFPMFCQWRHTWNRDIWRRVYGVSNVLNDVIHGQGMFEVGSWRCPCSIYDAMHELGMSGIIIKTHRRGTWDSGTLFTKVWLWHNSWTGGFWKLERRFYMQISECDKSHVLRMCPPDKNEAFA
jgi:hypothetical protein